MDLMDILEDNPNSPNSFDRDETMMHDDDENYNPNNPYNTETINYVNDLFKKEDLNNDGRISWWDNPNSPMFIIIIITLITICCIYTYT